MDQVRSTLGLRIMRQAEDKELEGAKLAYGDL